MSKKKKFAKGKPDDQLDQVENVPEVLKQIEGMVGRDGKEFVRDPQHLVKRKISSYAVLDWLRRITAHGESTMLYNVARERERSTTAALNRLQPLGHRSRPERYSKQWTPPIKTDPDIMNTPRQSRSFIDRGRLIRGERITFISVPIGGQPPKRRRKRGKR